MAPSFTRVGFRVRRALFDWEPLDAIDMAGRVVLVTGATSGLGLAAAGQLAAMGASVRILARNEVKAQGVVERLVGSTGNPDIAPVIADLCNLEAVAVAAQRFGAEHGRLDALVHNAGALSAARTVGASGLECTVASQVVAPFLLTHALLPLLQAAAPSRVLFVASGGMYSQRLDVAHLEMDAASYDGTTAYARAKRAQVELAPVMGTALADAGVVVHAMHPGWADTPGVSEALPRFRRIVGRLLRSPDEGADTIVWLAAAQEPLASTGGFWLDRRQRAINKVPMTRAPEGERARLWEFCEEHAGVTWPLVHAPSAH